MEQLKFTGNWKQDKEYLKKLYARYEEIFPELPKPDKLILTALLQSDYPSYAQEDRLDVIKQFLMPLAKSFHNGVDIPIWAYVRACRFLFFEIEPIVRERYCAALGSYEVPESYPLYYALKPHGTKQKVFILIGVPGSGKSTITEAILKFYPDTTIISRDIVRIETGVVKEGEKGVGNKEQETLVTEVCLSRLRDALDRGQNIIVDNTNISKAYRDRLKDDIGSRDVEYIYIYCQAANMEDVYKRREGDKWRQVIENMLYRLDFPKRTETEIIYISLS